MRMPDPRDPIGATLTGLTPLEPNPSRAEAVRRRVRRRLLRHPADPRATDTVGESRTAVAASVLLGLFSVFYALALLSTTLRIEGWLW
jgi:hypothetical protein